MKWRTSARELLPPALITPALQALLQCWLGLRLEPLPRWGAATEWYPAVTFLVSTGSAVAATVWPIRGKRRRARRILLGLVALVILIIIYGLVATRPPPRDLLWLYGVAAYAGYFGTYAAFGFCVGVIVDESVKQVFGTGR